MIHIKTPGLSWRRNRSGKSVAYWTCRQDIAKKGYPIKTVRLWSGATGVDPTPEEMNFLQRECYRLQGEMKEWAKNPNQRKSAKWRAKGEVYFVQSGNLVKIGFASNIGERLSQLRVSSPNSLELLGTIPGNRHIEQFLHWQFRSARERGEWFRMTDALRTFINEHVTAAKVANDCRTSNENANVTT